MSIDDAVAAGSFFDVTDHTIESGDAVDDALAEPGLVVVRGELRIGGQEHFYLECHTTLAVPVDGGLGLELHSSTQAPSKVQATAAVCKLPQHRVACHTKRLGGGFGGKETRTIAFAPSPRSALRVGRAVRLSAPRDVDMAISGQPRVPRGYGRRGRERRRRTARPRSARSTLISRTAAARSTSRGR